MSIIVKDKHQLFAFTVKDNRVDSTDYNSWFDLLLQKKCIVECKYPEYDSKGKLHYHGVLQIPKAVRRTKLITPGLHVKFIEVYDMAGWLQYCKKDQKKAKPTPMFKKAEKIVSQLVHEEPDTDSDIEEQFIPPIKSMFKRPLSK